MNWSQMFLSKIKLFTNNAEGISPTQVVKHPLLILLIFIMGAGGGALFMHFISKPNPPPHNHSKEEDNKKIWSCPMHPHIRQDKPGSCPICGMDLTLAQEGSASADTLAVSLSREAQAWAQIQTVRVSRESPDQSIKLTGRIDLAPEALQKLSTPFSGRIYKLLAYNRGEKVNKGTVLALISSPQMEQAQEEYLRAFDLRDKYPDLWEAIQKRMLNWGIGSDDLKALLKEGKPLKTLKYISTEEGVLWDRYISEGDLVTEGNTLFTLQNLNQLWAIFELPEHLLEVNLSQAKLSYSALAFPGKIYTAQNLAWKPSLDPVTRTAQIQVKIFDPENNFKPQMSLEGILYLSQGTKDYGLYIPKSAVLWTGDHSYVYIKVPLSDPPDYVLRKVVLGTSKHEKIKILEGLAEEDEVVFEGAFVLDASAQLQGKPSMLEPKKQE